MKKTDLYLYLNILNIIFAFYVVAMAFILFITLAMAPNDIMPACMFLLCIIIKFLLLPILFRIYEKKFPISILNKMQNELKTNKNLRASPPITNSFIFGTAATKIAPVTVFTIFFQDAAKKFSA